MILHVLVPSIPKNPDSPTAARLDLLREAADLRGIDLQIIDAKQCKMVLNGKISVLIENEELKGIDLLLSLPSYSTTDSLVRATLLQQFELCGVRVVNSFASTMIAKNKITSLQLLAKNNVPIPKTYAIHSSGHMNDMLEDIGRFPVIVKSVVGSLGIGVAIIESKRGLRSIADMMIESNNSHPLLLQEYIKESSGKDIRVFVVGNKIVAAMDRIAVTRGEFRSNFSLGGKVKIAELTDKEKKMAIKATRVCGLDYAGVDLIRSKEGTKVLEINSNPGFKGITEAAGADVAGEIIDYMVALVKKKKKK